MADQNPTRKDQSGKNSPHWKGGRTLMANGYMLVRVGRGHHLAHVTGYAYEHRVVAEEKIGRRLEKSEIVHHIDGNRLNNDPENLEVVSSQRDHAFHHNFDRRKAEGLRMLGEDNSLIECACGCGTLLEKFDDRGRPRRIVRSHGKTFNGQTLSIADWAERYNIPYMLLYKRLRRGWSMEQSLTTPLKGTK